MDVGNFLSSISSIALVALVATLIILLFELRHVFFHKKVVANPEIPDFDGNIHVAPEHATLIDVEKIEHGGINKTHVFILLIIMAILCVIIATGFIYKKKKPIPVKQTVLTPTAKPTEIIQIERISPTSPFGEIVEIPFDLSGTPTQITSTPEVSVTQIATASGSVVLSIPSTSTAKGEIITTQPTGTVANPSLPESGGFAQGMIFAFIPILLLAVALVL